MPLGEVTHERLSILREADTIVREYDSAKTKAGELRRAFQTKRRL